MSSEPLMRALRFRGLPFLTELETVCPEAADATPAADDETLAPGPRQFRLTSEGPLMLLLPGDSYTDP